MYGYEWTGQNGIYRLSVNSKIEKEIRPVFKEELDYFGFNEHWTYPDTDAPLCWSCYKSSYCGRSAFSTYFQSSSLPARDVLLREDIPGNNRRYDPAEKSSPPAPAIRLPEK